MKTISKAKRDGETFRLWRWRCHTARILRELTDRGLFEPKASQAEVDLARKMHDVAQAAYDAAKE